MIYTMNGMADQLNLIADHPGTYRGLSGHFSGDGFADMHFDVRAVAAADFQAWAASASFRGNRLDSAAYQALAKQSLPAAAFTYRDVDPLLFGRIVRQQEAPGPGPESGSGPMQGPDPRQPSHDISPNTGH
jgi:cytochrome o ubiquinol oxidase subunit 2